MYRSIKVGEKSVDMVANAATPIRYNMVFNDDFFATMTGDVSDAAATYMIGKLAFIMAKQAEKADMNKLNMDNYIEWLEQFDPNDLPEAADEIMNLYQGNMNTKSDPK